MFVDSEIGVNSNPCSSPQSPCKDITTGMDKLLSFGTMYLSGTYVLRTPIKLNRSVTIKSQKEKKGVLQGNGMVVFAFRIEKDLRERIWLKISNIHFDTIGVLKMYDAKESSINEFDNIFVTNTFQDK